MKSSTTRAQQSKLPEWLQMTLALLAIFAVFAACSGIPFFLGWRFGVWCGLLGAAVAIVCWIYLIKPMPGLFQGVIAITGLFWLLGLLIIWIIRVIKHVAA
jgi:hypothetical protein